MSPFLLMNETTLGRGPLDTAPKEVIKFRSEKNLRGCGQALIGRLVKSCLDRKIVIETEHQADELIIEQNNLRSPLQYPFRHERCGGPIRDHRYWWF